MRRGWAETSRKDTPKRVGLFYERLIHAIFGGVHCSDEDGDIVIWEIGLGLEVKASDNNHHFRVSMNQFRKQREKLEFPLSWYAYCLCSYKNRARMRQGPSKSLLAKCKGKKQVTQYLATNIDAVYVLDSEILEAMYRKNGAQANLLPGDGRDTEVLEIRRRELKSFVMDPNQGLSALGLDARKWHSSVRDTVITTSMDSQLYTVRFQIVEVLPKKLQRKLSDCHQESKSLLAIN